MRASGRLPTVLLVNLALLAACRQEPATSSARPRPVRVLRPSAIGCSDAPRFSGSVEPLVRVDLAFKRGGYVQRLLDVNGPKGPRAVDQGDVVRKGQVLAAIREGDYAVKLQQARAQLAQAQVAERQAKQEFERARALHASNAVPQALFEGAESKAQATTAQVQAARGLVDEATLALGDCQLRAPLDAQVMKRLVERGSLVGPGSPGFVLADTRAMKVIFGVADAMLGRVRPGTSVEVTTQGQGSGTLVGRVERVAPAADARSRLFDVEVILPNSQGALRAGMIAALRLPDEGRRPSTLTVPLAAVVRPPGETTGFALFVLEGTALKMRRVEPGEFCGASVEIRSGLVPTDQVVVDGAAAAYDGEPVSVAGLPRPPASLAHR